MAAAFGRGVGGVAAYAASTWACRCEEGRGGRATVRSRREEGDRRRFTVFLDVDGVLNSARTRAEGDARLGLEAAQILRHEPDPEMLDNLARVVRESEARTGRAARLVLSSTWRLRSDALESVEGALRRYGLEVEAVTPDYSAEGQARYVDGLFEALDTPNNVVPNSETGDRVDEIFSVVAKLRARQGCWIAIDDLNLPWRNPRLPAERFVRTNDARGLTAAKADDRAAKG